MSEKRIIGWNHWPAGELKACPDCGSDKFFEGPCGGIAQNVECAGCGHKFNLMGPFGVDRISHERPDPDGFAVVYNEERAMPLVGSFFRRLTERMMKST